MISRRIQMKKASKRFGKTIIFMSLVSLLVTGTSLAQSSNAIQALIESNLKIFKDGQQLTLRNAEGKKIDPVIIEGSVYLPIRSISETLGWGIEWDKGSKAVTLVEPDTGIDPNQTTTPVNEVSKPVTLVEFPGILDSKLLLTTIASDLQVGTVSFSQGGILKGKSARTTIDFATEEYDNLSLYMAVKKEAPATTKTNTSTNVNEPVEVRFLDIDGKKEIAFYTTSIRPTDGAKKFTLDLRGKKKIRIVLTSDLTDTQLILGDPIFH